MLYSVLCAPVQTKASVCRRALDIFDEWLVSSTGCGAHQSQSATRGQIVFGARGGRVACRVRSCIRLRRRCTATRWTLKPHTNRCVYLPHSTWLPLTTRESLWLHGPAADIGQRILFSAGMEHGKVSGAKPSLRRLVDSVSNTSCTAIHGHLQCRTGTRTTSAGCIGLRPDTLLVLLWLSR